MKEEKRDFDKVAGTWDEEPRRVKMAGEIGRAVIDETRPAPAMDVLDFGCGTGLLALQLQPLVKSVTCADSSRGMLDVLGAKVRERKLANVVPMFIDLDNGDAIEGRYDLVASSMALHHIKDIPALLDQLYAVTKPGGRIALADLDPDQGLFHAADPTGVFHNGFDREELRELLSVAGYTNIRDRTATTVTRPAGGEVHTFTIFLMTGEKKR